MYYICIIANTCICGDDSLLHSVCVVTADTTLRWRYTEMDLHLVKS